MPAPQFWELSVGTGAEISEGLTNFAWEHGALGVLEEEIDGNARMRAFFPAEAGARALASDLAAYLEGLRALGFPARDDLRISPVTDPGWAEAWREHFRPRAVGARLLIAPPWEAPDPSGRLTVVIEPGRAFGTGQHGSTLGCLEVLERIAERRTPPRALDLGTGSGILAIAAVRLGIPRVLAFDDDPDAVANARANVALNGMSGAITCISADAASVTAEPAPMVLANILATVHARLAPVYRGLVEPGGTLVLGGMLETEADATAVVAERNGFARRSALTRDGWTTIELSRRA